MLLSCASCRASKLKCDRAQPCGQCVKKGRPDGCAYAPRPEKKQPKSMVARLKRLEGMVRGMIDREEDGSALRPDPAPAAQESDSAGQFVQSDKTINYVGGTHFMSILQDVQPAGAPRPRFRADDGACRSTSSGPILRIRMTKKNSTTRMHLLARRSSSSSPRPCRGARTIFWLCCRISVS